MQDIRFVVPELGVGEVVKKLAHCLEDLLADHEVLVTDEQLEVGFKLREERPSPREHKDLANCLQGSLPDSGMLVLEVACKLDNVDTRKGG